MKKGIQTFSGISSLKLSNLPMASIVIVPVSSKATLVEVEGYSTEQNAGADEISTMKVEATSNGVLIITSSVDLRIDKPMNPTVSIFVKLPQEAAISLKGMWAAALIGRFNSNLVISSGPGAGTVEVEGAAYVDITMSGGKPIAVRSLTKGKKTTGPIDIQQSPEGFLTFAMVKA